jgi:DNA-binding transcriptional MocR family regulator
LDIFVNPSGETPIYRQIMRQITEAIAGGRLKPREKLASHRELSEQLVIAPLTVKKAYDELEASGSSRPSAAAARLSAPASPQPTPPCRRIESGRRRASYSRKPTWPGCAFPLS